jgi:hypothetical protein
VFATEISSIFAIVLRQKVALELCSGRRVWQSSSDTEEVLSVGLGQAAVALGNIGRN